MKTSIFYSMVFVLCSFYTNAWSQGTLEVTVSKIKTQKGAIRVGLFNSEHTFLKNAIEGKVVKADSESVTVVFSNLKRGDYAVSVIHDENENGEIDNNLLGMPKEGFAFGNNAMGTFGPPSFEKAKVAIRDKQKEIQKIDLKYL
jgi:uncharacterized protein (DUF2141 family)